MSNEYVTLLKNLKYFFNVILSSAQIEGDWTVDGIECGLGWALYCEKASQEHNVEGALISYLETKPFAEDYTIQDIQHLRKLLISTLFINQLIPKNVIYSLTKISERELGSLETQNIISASVRKVNSYQNVLQTLRKKEFEHTYNTLKVRLLIEATSTNSIPYSTLNHLLKTDGNLLLLLQLSETVCERERIKMLGCLGEWMKMSLHKNEVNINLFQQISSLPALQVSFICQKFPGLQNNLLCIINDIGNRICNTDYKNKCEYTNLITLCITFFKTENLTNLAKRAFQSWFTTNEGHFWHSVYVECHKESN